MSALTKIAFRKIGHFYEAFNDDARTIAPILELTLTERNGVPMCGFPYHMLDMCEKTLLANGIELQVQS